MVRGMKIGFVGAGGTGKTSTATILAPKLNLSQMKSASRIVYEARELTEEKVFAMNPHEKWQLQHNIFNTKIDADDLTPAFVADRTLLDHWAYCLLYCATNIKNEEFVRLEALVRKHMFATYSRIYYFPHGFWHAKGDGVRQDNIAWQSAVDAILVGHILKWKLPVVEVPQAQGNEDGNWDKLSEAGPEFRANFIIEDLQRLSEQVQSSKPQGPRNYEIKEGTQPPYPRVEGE